MVMNVPLMLALLMRDLLIHQLIVMIIPNVLLILVALILDVLTYMLIVMITTLVLKILVRISWVVAMMKFPAILMTSVNNTAVIVL
jgi:hypothetical protein